MYRSQFPGPRGQSTCLKQRLAVLTVIWIDLKVVQIPTSLQGISPIEVDIEKAKARIPRNETRVQSAEVRVLSVSTV